MFNREIEKLNARLGGLRDMEKLPGAVFVIDVRNEDTAIREADRMGIPIIAVVDTNCNPDKIDCVIPANDDALRAIRLMASKIADAALEGLALRKERAPEEEIYAEDEKYLSAETLARLRQIQFDDDEDEEIDEEIDEEYEDDYEDEEYEDEEDEEDLYEDDDDEELA